MSSCMAAVGEFCADDVNPCYICTDPNDRLPYGYFGSGRRCHLPRHLYTDEEWIIERRKRFEELLVEREQLARRAARLRNEGVPQRARSSKRSGQRQRRRNSSPRRSRRL